MTKTLVAFFSASGITKELSIKLATAINADIYEIKPKVPYTGADLDWTNQQSRSSVEMKDKTCRPETTDNDACVENYDVIFVGFPVWWYREPSIVDTFLESYNFSGKTVVPFCTSGGSGIGSTALRMSEILQEKAHVNTGKKFSGRADVDELLQWASQFI